MQAPAGATSASWRPSGPCAGAAWSSSSPRCRRTLAWPQTCHTMTYHAILVYTILDYTI